MANATTTLLERETPASGINLASAETFQNHLAQWDKAPDWLSDLKASAWERFSDLPMPTRRMESWRFAKTGNLHLDGYRLDSPIEDSKREFLIEQSNIFESFAGKMVFGDDNVIDIEHSETALEQQQAGLIWSPLSIAIKEHSALLRKFFLTFTPDLGSEKFQALHAALFTNGSFLYVPPGMEITLPFVAYHWTYGRDTALFPHTLVIADTGAKVHLVDIFQSAASATRHFACGMASIFAGAGAQVTYQAIQEWNLETLSFHLNTVTAERDANVQTVVVNLGSRQTRSEQHTCLSGAGSNVDNFALSVPTGDQEIDQRTLQTHKAPSCRSNLLYKNALLDDSRTIFSGLIKVEELAQQTDAYQTNRNLLLSNGAEANSLPGLEILANDVKCSHGATSGQIDEEQLHYLLARGISRKKAEELLVFGFFEEVFSHLKNEELRERLNSWIGNKFHAPRPANNPAVNS